MTSLASLILKLHELSRHSQFYFSQFLQALTHLPRIWRSLPVELHLTVLTQTVLRLARQLRTDSIIRIGAPPLLKLSPQTAKHEAEVEMKPTEPSAATTLFDMRKPVDILQERFYEQPAALEAITRTLLQSTSRRQAISGRHTTSRKLSEEIRISGLPRQSAQSSSTLFLGDETPEEESLREGVVETWLQRQQDSGIQPLISFAEAHKLYKDLFEEYVTTAILPPNLFAEQYLDTRGNLTFEQAKTDLRTRLGQASSPSRERSLLKASPVEPPIPSLLLPSYIPTVLWTKGSLVFGALTPPRIAPILSESTGIVPEKPVLLAQQADHVSMPINPELEGKPEQGRVINLTTNAKEESRQMLPSDSGERGTAPGSIQKNVLPTELRPQRWHWLKPFRAWEANREIFLYPENWVEPERRDNKTAPPHELGRHVTAYSPAGALYASVAVRSKVAVMSPLRGNEVLPTTPRTLLRPSLAVVEGLEVVTRRDGTGLPVKTDGRVSEQLERFLPVIESRPTSIYLRPPMSLPAVETTTQQRTLASILPSANVAATRESISPRLSQPLAEGTETSNEPGGYPEGEADMEEAETREQVKRFGRILAEEARRHIGST